MALSQLRQLLNVVHANVTYPSTMIIMIMLGLRDSNISHATVVHDFTAFAQAIVHRATGAEPDTQVPMQMHKKGTSIKFASRLDDYDHRPAELKEYSLLLLTML
jgi:hypothetical protein